MTRNYRFLISLIAIFGALLTGCASSVAVPSAQVQQVLAPSGKLRVGLYPGSPTSIIGDPASGQAKGVGFELGMEMAKQLGVPFEPVLFQKNADVLAAVKSGRVDMAFTNATAARAHDMDFSLPLLEIEKGFLVPPGSSMLKNADVDRPGSRVGVSQGSSTQRELAGEFKHAVMLPIPTLKHAIELMATGKLDAFATNKAILFKMSDELPGSRVLGGHWGLEHIALAIPKGQEPAAAFVRQFAADMKSLGLVTQSVQRVGLRGSVQAD